MSLVVVSLSGASVILDDISLDSITVDEVKRRASAHLIGGEAALPSFRRLLKGGDELPGNGSTLAEAGVAHGDTLTLVARWASVLVASYRDGHVRVLDTTGTDAELCWRFGDAAVAISWCGDGQRLAVASIFNADGRGKLGVYARASGQQEEVHQLDGPAADAHWAPGGADMAVADPDVVRVVGPSKPVRDLRIGGAAVPPSVRLGRAQITAAAWSPDGACMAIGVGGVHSAGGVCCLGVDSGRTIWGCDTWRFVHAVAWSADGARLAVAAGNPGQQGGVAVVLRATGGSPERSWRLASPALGVSWSPDGERLAIAVSEARARKGSVLIFSLSAEGQECQRSWQLGGAACCVAWSPDGERLAAGSGDGPVHVFDVRTGEETCRWDFQVAATALAWSPC